MGQFLDIAETVLRKHLRPMKPKAIVDAAKDDDLFSDKLSGNTPHQTMKAKLTVDVIRNSASRFVRTAPNTFFLRELFASHLTAYSATPQLPSGANEVVLVCPSKILDKAGRFQGIKRSWKTYFQIVLNDAVCKPIARMEAEQREDIKQLLTYTLVTHNNRLLCFRRGKFNRVEDYLRGSLCIGFGGHVSDLDRTLYNYQDYKQLIFDNASRELLEELKLPEQDVARLRAGQGLSILGLLNDDSSATGRKHLAVVLRYELSHSTSWERPVKGEKSINQLRWIDLADFSEELREFEYWSQLCLTEFYPHMVRTQPSSIIRRKAPFQGRHILCLIGGIGSGKSAATRILTAEYGYSEINTGRVMAKFIKMPPVSSTTREVFQDKAWAFIQRNRGPERLAAALLKEAKRVDGHVLIDGIRQRATVEALKKLAYPTKIALLFVYTPPHIAYEFYLGRGGLTVKIEKFLKLCDAPVEADIKKLIADADAILYNWTGKLKYEQAVRKLMQGIYE
ncbi:HTH domain-containing protein [Granulicella sp. L46]|uniref:HTH domain-containing protein n=1 Tax=Granulicella sp. L46 TaxID=1641865 RepID=UPI00131CD6D3|nr:HTH domain-containing protein [Granulicella sp. L46]